MIDHGGVQSLRPKSLAMQVSYLLDYMIIVQDKLICYFKPKRFIF